jgi:hypothetical protein
MLNIDRTFTVSELGKSVSVRDVKMQNNEMVEVIDLTTRVVMKVKAGDVSIYRHTLRLQGKSYNILRVR